MTKATAIERFIAARGQSATLRRVVKDEWADPPTSTATDYPCTAIVALHEHEPNAGEPAPALARTVYVLARGLTVEPDISTDWLIVGGVEHRIVALEAIAPAGLAVAWECRTRVGR